MKPPPARPTVRWAGLVLAGLLAAPAAAGRLEGRVSLRGSRPPDRPPIRVTVDPAVCGDTVPDASLVVDDDGGVGSAVVVLRGVPAGSWPPPPEALVDNAGCRFVPRVQIVRYGETVRVRNSDPVLHNTHAVLVAEPEVSIANLALAVQGQTMDLTRRLAAKLPPAGEAVVRIGCDVHPWMTGWLVVVEHPYAAVTDAHGRFAIADAPPGRYTLAVWHEVLGRAERAITVAPEGTTSADVSFAK